MEQEYNHPLYMLNYMLNKATRGGVSKAGAAASGRAARRRRPLNLAASRCRGAATPARAPTAPRAACVTHVQRTSSGQCDWDNTAIRGCVPFHSPMPLVASRAKRRAGRSAAALIRSRNCTSAADLDTRQWEKLRSCCAHEASEKAQAAGYAPRQCNRPDGRSAPKGPAEPRSPVANREPGLPGDYASRSACNARLWSAQCTRPAACAGWVQGSSRLPQGSVYYGRVATRGSTPPLLCIRERLHRRWVVRQQRGGRSRLTQPGLGGLPRRHAFREFDPSVSPPSPGAGFPLGFTAAAVERRPHGPLDGRARR